LKKLWFEKAWDDYQYWLDQDKKTLKKLNNLIKDIERNGNSEGIGKPEPLKGNWSGWYSRHIDDKNVIIYVCSDDGILTIAQCRDHYNDK
jgi:toxin YoeB